MSELKGACIIGQSGGPTAVINSSALGVIALLALAGLVCLGLSFLLSCRIVDRKEF